MMHFSDICRKFRDRITEIRRLYGFGRADSDSWMTLLDNDGLLNLNYVIEDALDEIQDMMGPRIPTEHRAKNLAKVKHFR